MPGKGRALSHRRCSGGSSHTCDVKAMDIDLLSLSAHKFYGPKGGRHVYSERRKLDSFIHGGGQEKGRGSLARMWQALWAWASP